MKKHKPNVRDNWIRNRRVIIQIIGVAAVLAVFSAGIFGAYILFAPNDKTTDVSKNNSDSDAYSENVGTSASGTFPTPASTMTATSTTLTESALSTAPTALTSASSKTSATATSVTAPAASTSEETASTAAATSKTSGDKAPDLSGYVVVIDPGHQLHANSEQESLGPDMSGTKDKCSSGTSGVSTGRPEYKVNLEIGLKLRDYLESLGCTVYMTRTSNDVDISNIDRADIALSHSPDVYIRLHCDGSANSSSRGVGVFVADTGKYSDSLCKWGDLLGEALSDTTGAKYRGCNASSVYSGLNWATSIPSFLLEMGFMSNATDDKLLSDPDYQQKICEGIADFVSKMPHISK